MSSGVLTVTTAGLAIAWLALYLTVRLRSRARPVPPGPVDADLGPEPPAVVNLLAHRWRLTADAAEATLLDLAARGFLQLRQPTGDPASTLVGPGPVRPAHLLPYERRVLDRVRRNLVDGQVPVTALTFRDEAQARSWQRGFQDEVAADARERGLSRRRVGSETAALLTAAGGMVALAAGLLTYRLRPDWELAAFVGVLVFTVAGGLAGGIRGDRDTVTGRQAAARWLGVRQWLAGRPGIAEVPPAAVHDWDRYLAYGAALGLTRATSTLLDLGMGDHRLVWSAFTGSWRRVRIHYPRGRPHLGRSVPGLLLQALLLGFFATMFGLFSFVVQAVPSRSRVPVGLEIASWVTGAVAALLLTYGGYALVRGLVDRGREREMVGEVLWVRVWRRRKEGGKSSSRSVPHLHYLAVDDGVTDQTTAWGLASERAAEVAPGDVVRIGVRPWTRRVTTLEVLRRGPGRQDAAEPAARVPSGLRNVLSVLPSVAPSLAARLSRPTTGSPPPGPVPPPPGPVAPPAVPPPPGPVAPPTTAPPASPPPPGPVR